jgi:hypothetical protein
MKEVKFTKEERSKHPYRSLACAVIWRGMRDRQEKDVTSDEDVEIDSLWYQVARGIPATTDDIDPDPPEPLEDTDEEWMLAQKLPCGKNTIYKWGRDDKITLRRMKVSETQERTFVKVDDRLHHELKRYTSRGS